MRERENLISVHLDSELKIFKNIHSLKLAALRASSYIFFLNKEAYDNDIIQGNTVLIYSMYSIDIT